MPWRLTLEQKAIETSLTLEVYTGAAEVNRGAIETKPGDMEALRVVTRETREGWPLLTAEVNGDGDSRSTYEKGHSLVGSLGS